MIRILDSLSNESLEWGVAIGAALLLAYLAWRLGPGDTPTPVHHVQEDELQVLRGYGMLKDGQSTGYSARGLQHVPDGYREYIAGQAPDPRN